jgi:hypothetical protein
VLFEAITPLGFTVRVTRATWELIIGLKHPVMTGREMAVRLALTSPDQARRSRTDADVILFYKAEGARRWTCAVAKRISGRGFLITAYPTDTIKEGEQLWPK